MSLKGVKENKTFQGYYLEFRIHPCDGLGQGEYSQFDFKGYLYSYDTVMIEGPVLDYTDMGGDDEAIQEFLEDEDGDLDKEDTHLMEAYDNARNGIIDRVNNQDFPTKKQWVVVFKNGEKAVQLSSEVLEKHKEFKDSNKCWKYGWNPHRLVNGLVGW